MVIYKWLVYCIVLFDANFDKYGIAIMLKVLAFGTLLAVSTFASAHVVVATDNFDTYASGNLNLQNGGSGWAGGWSAGSAAESVVNQSGDNWLAFTGNNNAAAVRTLSEAQTDKVIVDFNFQYSGTLNDNDFLAIWFGSSTGPNIGLKANCGTGGCSSDLFARTAGSGGSFAPGSDLASDTSYHIAAYLYKSLASASFDRIALWVNPTAGEMATLTGWDALFSGASGLSSFTSVGVRTANLDAGDSIKIDDLRIQTVPEPGSLALLGVAMMGLGAIRRKFSK